MPLRFSANLGYLWTDRPLPDAIAAAASAGFDAVELHWPYDVDARVVAGALRDAGLPCLSLNTRRGDVAAGEFGLTALPGREPEAREAIDEAIDYAVAIGAGHVHVMAGRSEGPAARATFLENLSYASDHAAPLGVGLLIEPLNPHDAPGYFLNTTGQALAVLDALDRDTAALMFDCYHVARTEGDVRERLRALLPRIGHIQFAGVPDRGPPDRGDLDYADLFGFIESLGYDRPLGAEYRPGPDTNSTLGWLAALR